MAIEPITFEDIGTPVDIGSGGIEPVDPTSLFGPTPPIVAPTPTPEPIIKPPISATDFFGTPYSLSPSIQEVSQLETDPFFRREMVDSMSETFSGLESLRQQPKEALRGTADFLLSIPGFLTGIGVAGQRMSKNLLDQLVLKQQFDLEELYDVASESMEDTMRFFEPGKEILVGKPTPESQLVGVVAMSPVMALSRAGQEVASWKRFEDSPNIRGVAKFVGDISGFIALGLIHRGGGKGEVAKRAEGIVAKAQDIKAKTELVEQVDNEALQRAQIKILEIQKVQLELEAAALKEDIKKSADLDPPLKADLKEKGKKSRKAKEEPKGFKAAFVIDKDVPEVGGDIVTGQTHLQVYDNMTSAQKAAADATPSKIKAGFVDETGKFFKSEELSEFAKPGAARATIEDLEVKGIEPLEGPPEVVEPPKTVKEALNLVKKKTEEGIAELEKRKGPILTKEEIDALMEPIEPTIELDRDVGVETSDPVSGERSPFYQSPEEAQAFKGVYEGRKSVNEDIEIFSQKLINDVNLAYHGDKSIPIEKVRDTLRRLAAQADDFRMDFLTGVDHFQWKENISEASEWASGLRLPIEQRGTKLYSGLPLDEAGKAIIEGGKKFMRAYDRATGLKKFKPTEAARLLNEEFKRNFVDRSGNIRLELLDKLGDKGYEIVQKMYLTKGANSLSANMLNQMKKEVYSGLSSAEKGVLDKVILADRMVDIGKSPAGQKFNYPEGQDPIASATYSSLFETKGYENLTSERAQLIRDRAKAHFEWMKIPLKDMLESGLISQEEFALLEKHNYRKIKLVDIFDRKYTTKIGKKKRTVHDSGVEALARGRTTDIFEPSSEIMALEVFNRAYGRVLNNEANKSLLAVARNDPQNPFVRVREQGRNVPSGWQRIFVFEEGERKPIYISPEMSKEWITNNPEISYRMGQFLRYVSASPVLRTFATGINWGFALANLPRDVMHTWFAARMFDGKKWNSVYSNQFPIFAAQIGVDLARVFTDAATKGPRYQDYIKEGGGMEFLVHQGRLFQRGRRLEGPADKIMDYLGYFGETSEIMTRLAIRDRVIRKRGKQQGLTMEEARKNKKITKEGTFAARDYMDFGQGGGVAKAADNALPYLNAAIQGTRGLWRVAVDEPRTFAYKIAQIGAATTLLYAAAKENAPKTMANMEGSEVMENNLIIPLGDGFAFEDERGQTRYPYLKMPLDPGQKFFNTFFQGAYDKYKGNEVDIDRITNSLQEMSPVGISNLPPTFSGFVGYVANKDFWRNEDIWRKTEPFEFPKSQEEFTSRTPQAFIDIGAATGLSPERLKFATEELTTSGTMWSYLVGKGYEELFADVPQEKREQHVAMTLAETPVVKRFFGITNPYSKFAGKIEKAQEADTIERFVQNRELDRLTEGHLFEKSIERKEVFKYINSFKEKDVRDRLTERFDYQQAIKALPERSFWLRLKGLNVEPRAQVYYARWKEADQEERMQLGREASIIGGAGRVLTNSFWNEFSRIRVSKESIE